MFRALALQRWLEPDDESESESGDEESESAGDSSAKLRSESLRNCELRRSATRGAHLVARRDLSPGDLVVAAGASVEALSSLRHCQACKRRGGAVACVSCGAVAYCRPCRRRGGEALFDWHRRECVHLGALAAHWEAPAAGLARRVLSRYKQRAFVVAVLRLAVHEGHAGWRGAAEGAADPWFARPAIILKIEISEITWGFPPEQNAQEK